MDELKPKAYVLAINDDNNKGAIISGFKSYNENDSIVNDLKAFLNFRFTNNPDKKLIQFQGTRSDLVMNKNLIIKYPNIEEKIKILKETNYLLIVGNI